LTIRCDCVLLFGHYSPPPSLVARASVCAWQKGTKTMSNDTSLVARASVCAWRAAALPLCRMDAKKDN
jgi:hypothetical protein